VAVGDSETIAAGRDVRRTFPPAVEIMTGNPAFDADRDELAPVPEPELTEVLLHAAHATARAATTMTAGR
jgi:hypothetical protein